MIKEIEREGERERVNQVFPSVLESSRWFLLVKTKTRFFFFLLSFQFLVFMFSFKVFEVMFGSSLSIF